MRTPTILFQPPNGIGLGHLSRLIAIASAVRAARPGVRMPFVIGGQGDHGLLEAHDFPHLALPDPFARDDTTWNAWSADDRRGAIFEIAATMVKALDPDLIVFDCFPHLAIGRAAFDRGIPVAICLRTMKDMGQPYANIRKHLPLIKRILVPHAAEECDMPDDLKARACFTGPIARAVSPHEIPPPRRDGRLRLVITGGGGGYPGTAAFYNLALSAFARARHVVPALDGVLVAGPLFREWWDLCLADGVKLVPFDPHLSGLLRQADLVICQAGYNTIAEIRAAGVPAVCVPAARESDDQFARARQAAAFGVHHYTGDDPEALARLILNRLSTLPARASVAGDSTPETGGARIAAESLLGLIESRHAAAH